MKNDRTPYWLKGQRVQNFGDSLTQFFMSHLFLEDEGDADIRIIGSVIDDGFVPERSPFNDDPAAVLSTRAIFWGCGIRTYGGFKLFNLPKVEILGVRGPISASELRLGSGTPVGDPALLLPGLYAAKVSPEYAGRSICVPHFLDERTDQALLEASGCDLVLRPSVGEGIDELLRTVDALASADFVLSSSLHAAIVAAAYGKPFAFWDGGFHDLPLKWSDFADSVGIPDDRQQTLAEAREWFATKIAPRFKVPDLWPLIANAPFPLRPDGLLKLAAHSIGGASSAALGINRLVDVFSAKRAHFEALNRRSSQYWFKQHERLREKIVAQQPDGDHLSDGAAGQSAAVIPHAAENRIKAVEGALLARMDNVSRRASLAGERIAGLEKSMGESARARRRFEEVQRLEGQVAKALQLGEERLKSLQDELHAVGKHHTRELEALERRLAAEGRAERAAESQRHAAAAAATAVEIQRLEQLVHRHAERESALQRALDTALASREESASLLQRSEQLLEEHRASLLHWEHEMARRDGQLVEAREHHQLVSRQWSISNALVHKRTTELASERRKSHAAQAETDRLKVQAHEAAQVSDGLFEALKACARERRTLANRNRQDTLTIESLNKALARSGEAARSTAVATEAGLQASVLRRIRPSTGHQKTSVQADAVRAFIDQFPDFKLLGPPAEGRGERIDAFLSGTKDRLEDFPLFSSRLYLRQYPDVLECPHNPLVHYIEYGQNEARNVHPLLDTGFYLAHCVEAVALGMAPVVHFILWGAAKRFRPSELFDTDFYFQRYPDVEAAGINPLAHYLKHPLCSPHPLFDSEFYGNHTPESLHEGNDPLSHYLIDGTSLSKDPHPLFSTEFYLKSYPDVQASGTNPLLHFLRYGAEELRDPHPLFSTRFYLEHNPDVLESKMNPLVHFVLHGDVEGRQASPHFSPGFYRDAYSDIRNHGLAPLRHYVLAGATEGRWPNSDFDANRYLRERPEQVVAGRNPLIDRLEKRRARNEAPVVLMADAYYPRPDRDSGSMDQISFIQIFRRLGYDVWFLADLEMPVSNSYSDGLKALGVRLIGAPEHESMDGFLRREGHRISMFFLSRFNFGGRHIEAARRFAPEARIVFNTVDLHHVRELREAELHADAEKHIHALTTRDGEVGRVMAADATIVVSDLERELIQELAPEAKIFMVPLIRDYAVYQRAPYEKRHGIAFIGSFEHAPNVDAVNYFLNEIWGLVQSDDPEFKLFVIGSQMPVDISRRSIPGVEFVGHVPDLEPWLTRVRLTIAPLRYGAGAKGKIVSSLAHGVPCVTTPVAAEGMGLLAGTHVEVASTPAEFARRLMSLYADPQRWNSFADAGMALVSERYSLAHGAALMIQIVHAMGGRIPHRAGQP